MEISTIERIAFAVIIAILFFAILRYKFKDYLVKRRQKARFARGMLLENKAHAYLESLGYSVVEKQKVLHHQYEINGVKQSSKLILDYIVKKAGKKYIVEVKSGQSAISITNSSTRRQLLEYDFSVPNHGIFLLDMENKKMQKIKFTSKAETVEHNLINFIIILAIVGILMPFWKIKVLLILMVLLIWKYPEKVRNIFQFINKRFQ